MSKTLAIVLIIVWMVFQYLPTRTYPVLPEQAVWFDDALVILLTLFWVSRSFLTKKIVQPTMREWSLLVFLGIGILSALLNSSPLSITVEGIRALIQPVFLYYIFISINFSNRSLKLFVEILFFMMAIQIIFYIIYAKNTGEWWGDLIMSTFGEGQGTGFGHFLTIGIFLLIGLFLYGERRPWYLLTFLAILIPLLATSSRISYFSIPLILAWLLRRRILALRKSVLLLGAFLVLLLVGLYFSYTLNTRSITFFENLNPARILQDQLRPNYSGRLIWYQYAWNKLVQKPVTLAVGYGPGMFSSFTAERNQTPIFMEISEIRTAQHFALLPASSYISVPAEFGLLGLLAYLIFIWSAYQSVSRALKNLNSKYWQGIAFGTKAALLYFLVAGITHNTWETSFVAGVIWLLVGIVYSAYRNQSYSYQLHSQYFE